MRVVSLLNSRADINTKDWVCYYCQGDKHVGWIEKRHVCTKYGSTLYRDDHGLGSHGHTFGHCRFRFNNEI